MALVKVRRAAQIILPLEIRQVMHLEEGDYLEPQFTDEGILLKPLKWIAGRGPIKFIK
jgi:AbrB family looped-hinge helix DNA binding protein